MKEIGGYIELDRYFLPMLHDDAIALNCGRNALAYLMRARNITKMQIPKLLCASIREVCRKENVHTKYYSISMDFEPKDILLEEDEWLYVVNYYGQIKNEKIKELAAIHKRIIVDNTQAYFQLPVDGVDTLYSCRKYFGVADGAMLYTDAKLYEELMQDESYDRMHFLLGRFECSASEFYKEYVENNQLFMNEPIKFMSRLTRNLLRGIDYAEVKKCRTENFMTLHKAFEKRNRLEIEVPEGAFMYPLYIEGGAEVRSILNSLKIYTPTLWPDVFDCCSESESEYDMAKNILPLPIDQRYNEHQMRYIIENISKNV